MVSNAREDADFLALAIKHGVLEPDAAVDWACEILLAEKDPHAVIVELAGVVRPQRREVIELLDSVPGLADPQFAFRRLLGLMLRQLQSDEHTLADVTIALRQMVDADAVPEELVPQCNHFDHALLCAQDGLTIDTVDDVRKQVLNFLAVESVLSHPAPTPIEDEPKIVSKEFQPAERDEITPISDSLRRTERFEELIAKVTPLALQRHSTNLIRHYTEKPGQYDMAPDIEAEDFEERGVVLAHHDESSLVLLTDGTLAEIRRSYTESRVYVEWSATLTPMTLQEAVARYDVETCLAKLTTEFGLDRVAPTQQVHQQVPPKESLVAADMDCPCGSGKPFIECHGAY